MSSISAQSGRGAKGSVERGTNLGRRRAFCQRSVVGCTQDMCGCDSHLENKSCLQRPGKVLDVMLLMVNTRPDGQLEVWRKFGHRLGR